MGILLLAVTAFSVVAFGLLVGEVSAQVRRRCENSVQPRFMKAYALLAGHLLAARLMSEPVSAELGGGEPTFTTWVSGEWWGQTLPVVIIVSAMVIIDINMRRLHPAERSWTWRSVAVHAPSSLWLVFVRMLSHVPLPICAAWITATFTSEAFLPSLVAVAITVWTLAWSVSMSLRHDFIHRKLVELALHRSALPPESAFARAFIDPLLDEMVRRSRPGWTFGLLVVGTSVTAMVSVATGLYAAVIPDVAIQIAVTWFAAISGMVSTRMDQAVFGRLVGLTANVLRAPGWRKVR